MDLSHFSSLGGSTTYSNQKIDVLICGAGPTGLALAVELLRRKISIRIIDAAERPSYQSKALGIHARTLECFEKMDVIDAFLKHGLPAKGVAFHWGKKNLILRLDLGEAPYPYVLIIPQDQTEELLIHKIHELGGHVERKIRFEGFQNGHAEVMHENGKKEIISAPWIIGCDGAHSQVRHALQIPFRGAKFSESFLLADVESKLAKIPQKMPNLFFSKKGTCAIIPLKEKDCFRLIFPLYKEKNIIPSMQVIQKLLNDRGLDATLNVDSIRWMTNFHIHRRMVSDMRHKNVLLVGDAAHIHSPIGGQGMNTSIQDACNLAWKLALVIQYKASDKLIDTYQHERNHVAKAVLKGTTRATHFFTWTQHWLPFLFYAALDLMLHSPKLLKKMSLALSELSISYPKSKIIAEPARDRTWKGPKPGKRAPDVILQNGKHLFELLKSTDHILLLFQENAEITHVISQKYEWIQPKILHGQSVCEKYQAEPDSVYLIRPDGFIGYRSKHCKLAELTDYLDGLLSLHKKM